MKVSGRTATRLHAHTEKLLADVGAREDGAALEGICEKFRVPTECRDLARLAARAASGAARGDRLSAEEKLNLLESSDAFRRPQRLADLLRVAEAECYGAKRWIEQPFASRRALQAALAAARTVDSAALAAQGGDIPAALRAARVKRIAQAGEAAA